jgi:polygalacturonase
MQRLNAPILVNLTLLMCALLGAQGSMRSIGAEPELDVKPKSPEIPHHLFNLKDFGGVGDGKRWNTDAFRRAVAAIEAAGGGRLIVPAGTYRTGPIALCSQLDLHLDDGAVIQAPETFADYGLPEPETLKTQGEVLTKVKMPAPLISGNNLHDVALTGTGVIDGAGALWWAWSERAERQQPGRLIYPRPKMVVIDGCQRLHVEGVTFRNSPRFHLVPTNTTDLLIEQVKVVSPPDAPNTDGIDPTACTNVLIRNCDLDVGDDDIVIKHSGSNILIEDCRIHHGHGISIGSDTAGGVRKMLVRRCTLDRTDNGIRIKSMRGAGGIVEDICYTDIQMQNVGNAIVLDLLYTDNNRPNFRGDPLKIPQINDIKIYNVKVENARNAGRIVGLPDSHITAVTLQNVEITADHDLVVHDADHISMEQVSRKIRNSVP